MGAKTLESGLAILAIAVVRSFYFLGVSCHDGAVFRNNLPLFPPLPFCVVRKRHGF
jgi:hypothetical protein